MLLFLLLLAGSPVPPESRQLVLAVTPGWDETHGRVFLYERKGPARAGGEAPISVRRPSVAPASPGAAGSTPRPGTVR